MFYSTDSSLLASSNIEQKFWHYSNFFSSGLSEPLFTCPEKPFEKKIFFDCTSFYYLLCTFTKNLCLRAQKSPQVYLSTCLSVQKNNQFQHGFFRDKNNIFGIFEGATTFWLSGKNASAGPSKLQSTCPQETFDKNQFLKKNKLRHHFQILTKKIPAYG